MASAAAPQHPVPDGPAMPILGSHFLAMEQAARLRFAAQGERISTACQDLDDYVLGGGGVERGVVMGISGDGSVEHLVSLNLLASVLLSHAASKLSGKENPNAEPVARVIDTTGSFPIALLANIICSRIRQKQGRGAGLSHSTRDNDATGQVEEEAQLLLERVAVSRVFDIEGLWEVLGEVGRPTKSSIVEPEGLRSDDVKSCQEEMKVNKTESPADDELDQSQAPERTPEIADSEEETTSDEDISSSSLKDSKLDHPLDIPQPQLQKDEDEGTQIIIIDNMSHIINDLFSRKEKNEAHLVLQTLARALHSQTRTNNILLVLHNTVVPIRSGHLTNTASSHHPNYNQQHHTPLPIPNPSIFTSAPHKPALGRIFDQFPELHILISPLPRDPADATLLYGHDDGNDNNETTPDPRSDFEVRPSSMQTQKKAINYVHVLEVLKDACPRRTDSTIVPSRFGAREQRWTALDVDPFEGGTRLVAAFPERGRGKMAKRDGEGERESEGIASDVGSVAKIYGFGGRRV